MKPLTVYAFVLGASVMALLSSQPEEKRPSYYAPLSQLELETPSELSDFGAIAELPSRELDEISPKSYHVYFNNRSSNSVYVYVKYICVDGSEKIEGPLLFKPRQQQEIAVTPKREYHLYVERTSTAKKNKQKASFRLPLGKKAKRKIPFERKEIWECYNTKMCNTFAVFR